jgi:hypothetical protein
MSWLSRLELVPIMGASLGLFVPLPCAAGVPFARESVDSRRAVAGWIPMRNVVPATPAPAPGPWFLSAPTAET